ncbi:MAG: 50S ribosomal protein L18 [Polyangiales bacterium]
MSSNSDQRQRRKARIRGKVSGTQERPRLTVFRSSKHIYAQVIDDATGCTLVAASSTEPSVREATGDDRKLDVARKVGEAVAKKCLEKGITKVVFDRNGYVYQANNRVGVLADSARKVGLNF